MFKDISRSCILDISKNSFDARTINFVERIPTLTINRLDIGNEIVRLYSHLAPLSKFTAGRFILTYNRCLSLGGGIRGSSSKLLLTLQCLPTLFTVSSTNKTYIPITGSCLFEDFLELIGSK